MALLNTGRTSALAGAAKETEIKVLFETIAETDAALSRGVHQMNSAARRFRLQAKHPIGRALI
jgi:hypothetical protein